MPCCKTCGCCTSRENLDGGLCCICAAQNRGEKPAFTIPRDEWEEMSAADRKAARKAGITPHVPPRGEDTNVPTGFQ